MERQHSCSIKSILCHSPTHHCIHLAGIHFRLADLDVPLPSMASSWQASIDHACYCSNNAALYHIGQLLWVPLCRTTGRQMLSFENQLTPDFKPRRTSVKML